MNYTKGKWTIETHKDAKYPDIETYTILAPNPDAGKSGVCYSGSHLAVAQLDYLPDAHLISAAPDMYEALKAIVDYSRDSELFSADVIADAICALDKATAGHYYHNANAKGGGKI